MKRVSEQMALGITDAEAMATRSEGRIHYRLAGKTVQTVMTDGEHLVIRTTDGSEVYIRWNDKSGLPEFVKMNARVMLPTAGAIGGAGRF